MKNLRGNENFEGLKEKLEIPMFHYGEKRGVCIHYFWDKEENKSFCGRVKDVSEDELEIPYYYRRYETFYDFVNDKKGKFLFCEVCK